MTIVIAGAVAWDNITALKRELIAFPRETLIVHGDSPGADALGGEVAAEMGFRVLIMKKSKADYAKYQRGAWKGLNERMLGMGTNLVLIFHSSIEQSRGSKHLAELARVANIEVHVFSA